MQGKRLISLFVAAVMVFCMAMPAFAAGATPFTDIRADWYKDAVEWAYSNEIVKGTSATTFSPNVPVTRSMLVTMLYRIEGEPAVSGSSPFNDVPSGQWYSDAITWAASKGMINGVGDNRFYPNNPITRQDIVTILWRYAGQPGTTAGTSFADDSSISDYAKTAVSWSQKKGIVVGKSDNRFAPKDNATRAEIVTILYRYIEKPNNTAPSDEELRAGRAREILAEMSLHEKVCQLFIVSPETITGVQNVTVAGSATQQALAKWPVGGFIYNRNNMVSIQQMVLMTSGVQSFSKIPLILTCDEEGGRVNRLMSTVGTTYIGPMYNYKDAGPKTAYNNAETIAKDMVSCGLNTDLAPVADVWSNPNNTVIGDRAYSDDFAQAAELIASAVEGFHAGGVACTLKHFPGHGNTTADSHYGTVYVNRTLKELRENELLPFQAGIDAGADAVMIGHLIVSDIDSEPAPLSYKIVTELLREEMGFQGVIMTDALQMQAMTDHYSSAELAVKAVQAGVDILLEPSDFESAVFALTEAVKSGKITEERLDESVLCILELKLRQGILK